MLRVSVSDAGPLERSQTGVGQHRGYIRRSVQNAYLLFGAAVAVVAMAGWGLGRLPRRWSVSERALKRVEMLVAIVAGVTAAGLLAFAFLAERIASAEDGLPLLPGSTLELAAAGVMLMLSVGAAGLLAAVLAALCSGQFKRFAGRCLAASALIVVVLFPTTVALVHDTVQAAEAANG